MGLKGRSSGAIKRGSFYTYWFGVDQSQRGYCCVGFILSERLSECVKGYEYLFKPLEEREEFWADVRDILVKCVRNKRIVILGAFNGWVGVQRDTHAIAKSSDVFLL
ncbi:hypothetical protein EVAR_99305_1 [Eumeta japonica]|uniref:Uncharacterized protein n=1 Tax=Eumeta variegata TaxID=151549 RepID=A0A4C1YXT9_EUMVA|nr:hypothetical protein EVAR_99305_1 [Eumeta japonica]